MLTLLLLLACAHRAPIALGAGGPGAPALSSELADLGGLRARLPAPDDADVVIHYGGEQQGELGTCGCEVRPRGSVARVAGYRRAFARVDDTPSLLVNAGRFLDDTIDATGRVRADAVARDRAMLQALADWDVLNVAVPDLPFLLQEGALPPTAVSANLKTTPEIPVWRRLRVGAHDVVVTGVTADALTFLPQSAYTLLDPVVALTAALPDVADADLVVVLAWGTRTDTGRIASIPGIDLLIEAGGYQDRWEPYVSGGTVWVRSDLQTQRLGEVRLRLGDGVIAARDRLIDLDDAIPEVRRLKALERTVRP